MARRASEAAAAVGVAVEVRCADAGDSASFDDVLPVDVLLLCGIFGNVEHERVKRMIEVVPELVGERGYVTWTRGASEPDAQSFATGSVGLASRRFRLTVLLPGSASA